MAPLPALSSLSATIHTLAKRQNFYNDGQPPAGALIGGIVFALVFLLIIVLVIVLRFKYGWGWYGRPYRYTTSTDYNYSAPYNSNYNGTDNRGGAGPYGNERRWPGQTTAQFGPTEQVGNNGTEPNAHGTKMGPGTYQPPPLYSGPGTFYQSGRHGPGTTDDDGSGSRLQEHPALRNPQS